MLSFQSRGLHLASSDDDGHSRSMSSVLDFRQELVGQRDDASTASSNLFKLARRLKLAAIGSQVLLAVAIGFFGGHYGPWLGMASLVPTLIGMAQRMFAPEAASGWHYEKRLEIDRLLCRYDEGEEPSALRRAYLDMDAEMAKRFPHGSWM